MERQRHTAVMLPASKMHSRHVLTQTTCGQIGSLCSPQLPAVPLAAPPTPICKKAMQRHPGWNRTSAMLQMQLQCTREAEIDNQLTVCSLLPSRTSPIHAGSPHITLHHTGLVGR